MSGNASGHRQRAVMASDAEWEIIGQVAKRGGMDRSRYLIHRALMPDALPTEVLRRAVRELLVLFRTLFDGGFPRLFRAVDAQMSHIILALPDRGTVFDDVFSARLMKARGDRFARLVGM